MLARSLYCTSTLNLHHYFFIHNYEYLHSCMFSDIFYITRISTTYIIIYHTLRFFNLGNDLYPLLFNVFTSDMPTQNYLLNLLTQIFEQRKIDAILALRLLQSYLSKLYHWGKKWKIK